MWYQGEEQMPPIVKSTYRSIKAHAGEHPVLLITKDNIRELVSQCTIWDDEIFEYLERGNISITHFSDLFRTCVLYTFGGIWIDSTILMNRDVDDIVGGLSFFSGRRDDVTSNFNVPQGKWTTYFIGTSKGNLLLKFIYDVLLQELKIEGRNIEYFMMDYAFVYAYDHFQFVRDMIAAIPPMKNTYWQLLSKINQPFVSKEEFAALRSNSPFFKLTYKGKLRSVTDDGRKTYYAYIAEELEE